MEFNKTQYSYPKFGNCNVAIIGLGYVGLPLAVELAKKQKCLLTGKDLDRKIIGYDIDKNRLEELRNCFDRTNEVSKSEISNIDFYDLTSEIENLTFADVFIITVPTPINKKKQPNLAALKSATTSVAKALKLKKERNNDFNNYFVPVVIYESTVYPGTTEEISIPLIEKESGLVCDNLKSDKSFSCGYSPERINPGDKEHKIKDIVKVTSGSNKEVSNWINKFYGSIISAGTHKAESIKIAEAAKVIENTQRDINIALVNELAIIFKLLNIDTLDVLKAASTKWNFLHFKPGLVGGHCIGVDPYYLTYKAESMGYLPEVVLSGRKINDGMAKWIVDQLLLEMFKKDISIKSSNILILGFTFKENCPDTRNTKVLEIVKILGNHNVEVDVVDPWVNKSLIKENYDLEVLDRVIKDKKYSVVISAVAHKQFLEMSLADWSTLIKDNGIFFDLKGLIPRDLNPLRL